MAEDFPTQAYRRIDAFIEENPGYTRAGVPQPSQGSTNCVVFGRLGEKLVVFKVFCEVERKQRECFAFEHWHATSLVPELLWADDPSMIIMSHVPGKSLGEIHEADRLDYHRDIGRAVARLVSVPISESTRASFEARFHQKESGTFEAYLQRILDMGRGVQELDGDFADGYWRESLDFIEAQLPFLLAQPRVLYNQDAGNCHMEDGVVTGFFDLEMCRIGIAVMQIAAAPGPFDGAAEWRAFRAGWEEVIGRGITREEINAVSAAKQFLGWREITRYLSYDGTPGTGYS
jgi:hypothetical protein